jgi:hypothetical protein
MTGLLTILSWKWHGWRGDTYRAEHVNALARMLAEHMTGDYRRLLFREIGAVGRVA